MIQQQCGLDASAPVIRIAQPVALSSVTGLWPASQLRGGMPIGTV